MAWPERTHLPHIFTERRPIGRRATSTPSVALERLPRPIVRVAFGPNATYNGALVAEPSRVVRLFDGLNDSVRCSIGSSAISGGVTIAVLVKISTESSEPRVIFATANGGSSLSDGYALSINGFNELELTGNGTYTSHSVLPLPIDSHWKLIVVRGGAIGATEFDVYDFSLKEWILSGPGVGTAKTLLVESVDRVSFGENGRGAEFCEMVIAAAAIWPARMISGQVDLLAEVETLREWQTVLANETAIAGLWLFSQRELGVKLHDLTGNGADQTSRTDTEIIAEEPPIPYGEEVEVIVKTVIQAPPPKREYQLYPRGS